VARHLGLLIEYRRWTQCGIESVANLRKRLADYTHSAHRQPVSGTPKRKLENGEQRLAPQSRRSKTEILRIADQRLGRDCLTHWNHGDSHTPGNHDAETELAG
jgi:hypothetical protein